MTPHVLRRPFFVIAHDVASPFVSEIHEIVECVRPVIDSGFMAAVVPRWHGGPKNESSTDFRRLVSCFDECLLHGWTHQSRSWLSPVSLLTNRADEFRGLDRTSIEHRLEMAQNDFRDFFGYCAEGLVPPAWQLPTPSFGLRQFRYVMRFRVIEDCRDVNQRQRIATWSWDWGRVRWPAFTGEFIAKYLEKIEPTAIPCVVIHPQDVKRGYMPRIRALIERLIEDGFTPTTVSQIMDGRQGR
ncbi:MAG: hypothetical protein FJ267_01870 [Planctomycetes bacterium]|nr:hypothetical protein [Planctomycetota bacterium]